MVKNTRNQQVRGGVALPPVKRARPLNSATSTWSQTYEPRRYAGSNKGTPTGHQAGIKTITFLPLSHLADPELVQPEHESTLNKARVILLSQLLTNDGTTLCSTPVNLWLDAHRSARKTAPLLVCSSIATTPCRSAMLDMCSDLRTHVIRQARIEVTAAYALNHLELRVLKLSELLQDFVYLRQDPRNPASPRFLNSAIAAIIARAFYNNGKWGIGFLSANMMALVGTVLYNAIKEYHDDGTRKIIYFHGHTVEDNYNAIREKWKRLSEIRPIHANHIENSGSNVTVPDDHHDNDVDDILMKCTDDERQRYNTLIEDYNRAGKREDNILTVDECRTGHSNEEDIEADEREEETRVRLRESSGEIHDILLREFRGADDFTESVTHNDDEQVWFQNKGKGWSIVTDSTWDEFAMLAEEYTIDNRIVHALALTKDEWELELEDCDALVERYEEEINCSDLYSTV
ncbi:hypothetical protein HBH77_100990 [Parastagonospora nodorum]|nr:hypothetical protein HBH77_100990 [Parastagonospora nodorum]